MQNYFTDDPRRGWKTITVEEEAECMRQLVDFEAAEHVDHAKVKFRIEPFHGQGMPEGFSMAAFKASRQGVH